MFQIYKNIFFHFYKWKKKDKKEDFPEYIALLLVTSIIIFNIITVLSLILYFNLDDGKIIKYFELNRIYKYPPLFLLLTINYFVFLYKGKYKKIVKEFEKRETVHNVKKTTMFILSLLITFLGFIGVLLLFYLRNEL